MSVKQIIGTGLARALGTGLIGDLAGDAVAGAVKSLKDHLTLDGKDLAAAFQDSLSRGATAIALGLSAEGAGVLTLLGQGTRRALVEIRLDDLTDALANMAGGPGWARCPA